MVPSDSQAPIDQALRRLAADLERWGSLFLGRLRNVPAPLPAGERRTREAAIRAVLDRIRAFAALGIGPQHTEVSDG